jgi:hypothetical protein
LLKLSLFIGSDDTQRKSSSTGLDKLSQALHADLGWAKHNVRSTCASRKKLQHPLVGALAFEYARFQVIDHPGIRCHIYIPGDEETTRKLHQLL